tara:strand:+ start:402 stop:1430 length:1029 start_codon:yes stop_codon:yes gene_type:complete
MRKINWGVLGLGNVAQKFLQCFSEIQNSNLLAIASKDPVKLEHSKKKFNIKNDFAFEDYEKLIKCEEIDIVYISLPNSLHLYWITKCIKNKKKVLVEKPAILNFEEAINLKNTLEKEKIFFAEGFMYRYDPLIMQIINLIKKNEIGDLLSLETSFGVNLLTKKKFIFFKKNKKINKNDRKFNKNLGGGCILDLGCYTTSLTILISSLLKNKNNKNFKIRVLEREIGETGVDIHSKAKIIYENGFISKVNASYKDDLGNNTIIKGKNGEIHINNTFLGIEEIRVILNNGSYIIKKKSNKNIYSEEIENISQNIIDGADRPLFPAMQLEETLLNMKILESWKNE